MRHLLFTFFISFLSFHSATAQNWNEIIKATASDRASDDHFGHSVAVSGNYAIVGAITEDEDTLGGNTVFNAGSAYIFYNNSGTWIEVQKIVASDRGATVDIFGSSVAISGDYAIVGAELEDEDASGGNTLSNAGSAYIFHNNGGTWTEVQKIVASDRAAHANFGNSIAISGDYAVVGAFREHLDTSGGNYAYRAGSAYIFYNNAGTWTEVQKIVASDRATEDHFGASVGISGDYAIVGAFGEDEDASGGNTVSFAGSAYIFYNNAGTWTEVQKLVASDRAASDNFGYSVAISGDYAIVGAFWEDEDASGGNGVYKAGSAYIFYNNASTWAEVQKIVASHRSYGDEFGNSVAISGDYIIVGADGTGGNAGSAFIFHNNAGTWAEVQEIVASDRAGSDLFGSSVGISGDYAIVGAYWEDEDTTGGNTASNAGSAYIFENCSNSSTDVITACNSYTWIDGITYTSNNNSATHTLTNSSGCDSVVTLNLSINKSTAGTEIITACNSYTWIDGITYTSSNDSATYVLTNAAGCDSVVNLDLSIRKVETAVNQSDLTLTANADSATYQWLDCGNTHSIIPGETGRSFTATANGTYAVEITESGCVDTSACFVINNVGLAAVPLKGLRIYPNPSSGKVSIEIPASGEFALKLFDASGKLIFSDPKVKGEYELDLSGYAKGLYRVHLQGDASQMSEWIVRE